MARLTSLSAVHAWNAALVMRAARLEPAQLQQPAVGHAGVGGTLRRASARTTLMRATPAGLRLPKMPGSLETSLSGQFGFQVANSSGVIGFLIEAVPRVSGAPLTRLATTSLFFRVATSALV